MIVIGSTTEETQKIGEKITDQTHPTSAMKRGRLLNIGVESKAMMIEEVGITHHTTKEEDTDQLL